MSTFVYLTAAVPASGENHPARGHPRPRPGTDDFRSVARRTPNPMPPARHCARSAASVALQVEHSTERVGRGGARARSARRPRDRGGPEEMCGGAAGGPSGAAPALPVGCGCPPEGAPKRLPLCPVPGGNPAPSIARFPRRFERGGGAKGTYVVWAYFALWSGHAAGWISRANVCAQN
jgi:hypothetical protein